MYPGSAGLVSDPLPARRGLGRVGLGGLGGLAGPVAAPARQPASPLFRLDRRHATTLFAFNAGVALDESRC